VTKEEQIFAYDAVLAGWLAWRELVRSSGGTANRSARLDETVSAEEMVERLLELNEGPLIQRPFGEFT